MGSKGFLISAKSYLIRSTERLIKAVRASPFNKF